MGVVRTFKMVRRVASVIRRRMPAAATGVEWGVLAALLVGTVWLGQITHHNTSVHAASDVSQGPQVAPVEIPATTLAGEPVLVKLDGRGRAKMLLVLSTSCPYCSENMAPWRRLVQAVESLGSRAPDLLVLSVSAAEETREYLDRHDVAIDALLIDRSVLALLGLRGYPSTVTIAPGSRSMSNWSGVLAEQEHRTLMAWARTAASDGVIGDEDLLGASLP